MISHKKNYIASVVVVIMSLSANSVIAQGTPTQLVNEAISQDSRTGLSYAVANSPTLKKIRDTGVIKIGYRQIAPISYDIGGKATGYAVEICNEVVDEIRNFLDVKNIKVEHYQITSQQRMSFLQAGQIDLECGITTNTAERRNTTAFSVPYFITGTKMLLLKQNANIYKSINDMTGLPVATVKSTTAVKTIDVLNKQRLLDIKNTQQESYEAAVSSVLKGTTKAMLLDEIILEDLRLKSENPAALTTAGDFVSIEPLAIMMRKEKPLQDIVNKRMVRIIQNGQMETLYTKWFKKPVPPDSVNYNLDMSSALREIIRMPNDIVGN